MPKFDFRYFKPTQVLFLYWVTFKTGCKSIQFLSKQVHVCYETLAAFLLHFLLQLVVLLHRQTQMLGAAGTQQEETHIIVITAHYPKAHCFFLF